MTPNCPQAIQLGSLLDGGIVQARPVIVAVAVLLLVSAAIAAETARVVEVVDGDTIKVELAGTIERVRLIGVDTPETVHPLRVARRELLP